MFSRPINPPRYAYGTCVCLAGLAVGLLMASARLRGLLLNSTLLSLGTLAVSLPVGSLIAVAVVKTSIAGRRLAEGFMLAMLFVPLYVHATAWQAALGHGGWLKSTTNPTMWFSGWTACIWIHGLAAIPWVVLFVATALRSIRPELEEESLQDAPPGRVIRWVSMPGATSGILAAALWVTLICFGEIAVTDLYQVRTFAEEVYTAASLGVLSITPEATDNGALTFEEVPQLATQDLWIGTSVVLFLTLATLVAIWSLLQPNDATSSESTWKWQPKKYRWLVGCLLVVALVTMLGIPALSLFSKAGATTVQVEGDIVRSWSGSKAAWMVVDSFWQHRREWGWSLAIAFVAVLAAILVGAIVAWALRTRRLPTAASLLFLALLFTLPGPVLAVAIIGLFNHPHDSLLEPLTWCYNHTLLAPTLVQFLRALPVATLIMWSQFETISEDVLENATSEGATWWQTFFHLAIPLRAYAILASAVVALIVAVSELPATLLVAPPGVSTLPMRIFGLLHYGSEDKVSALCLALALVVGGVVLGVQLIFTAKDHASRPSGEE